MQKLTSRQPRSKQFIDHTGERLGTLTAISFAGFQGKFPKWRCRCQCGRTRTIFAHSFGRPGAFSVCRCTPQTKDTYLYEQWRVRVSDDCCPEWTDFNSFRDAIGRRPKGKFLSKRRLSEPWSSENFVWVSKGRKLPAKLYEFNGKKQTAREWCEELKISRQRLHQRMSSGAPKERVFAPRGGLPESMHSNTLFPWESIADGKDHRLVRGKEFDCDPSKLERSLNNWAKKNKAEVSVKSRPRDVIVRIRRRRHGRS